MYQAPVAALIAAAILSATPAEATAQANGVDSAGWLAGCWTANSGSRSTEEVWTEPKGGLMMGLSRVVRDGVATGYEFLLLRSVEGRLTLTAHPSSQTPTDFAAVQVATGLVHFENRAHDFPQKIEYHRVRQDSLVAKVYSDADDSSPAFELRYGRTPCPERPDGLSDERGFGSPFRLRTSSSLQPPFSPPESL